MKKPKTKEHPWVNIIKIRNTKPSPVGEGGSRKADG
jgi:hypothetical protein